MNMGGHTSQEQLRYGAGAVKPSLGQGPGNDVHEVDDIHDVQDAVERPPPLQVSQVGANDGRYNASSAGKSPMRSASDTAQFTARLPRSVPSEASLAGGPSPSPQTRLDERLASDYRSIDGGASSGLAENASRTPMSSPPKSLSYSQLRNVSSPLPDVRSSGHSSPPSPRNLATPPPAGSPLRGETGEMPRTSSIDSAISTFSASATHAHKISSDGSPSKSVDISRLISAAGSPEAVIHHLLKEKQHAAAQNSQLWKLVDKQRSLLLGLNKDLERALDDKERYKRKLKATLESASTSAATPRGLPSGPAAHPVEPLLRRDQAQGHAKLRDVPEGLSYDDTISHDTLRGDPETPGGEVVDRPLLRAKSPAQSSPRATGFSQSAKQMEGSNTDFDGSHPFRRTVTPIHTKDLAAPVHGGTGIHTAPIIRPSMSPTSSFTLKRSQTNPVRSSHGLGLDLTDPTPITADVDRMTPPRKAPPAPLDLGGNKREALGQQKFGPEDHSDSEYDDNAEVDELPILDRGRKSTREDDDRDREAAISREKAARSRSEKEKAPAPSSSLKSPSTGDDMEAAQAMPRPLSIKHHAPETPSTKNSFLSPPTSLAGVLQAPGIQGETRMAGKTLSAKPPISPGLPLSPRPIDRPMNPPTPRLPRDGTADRAASPPLSPKAGLVGLPLSPRAPKQAIPLPPSTPMSMGPASPSPFSNELRKDSLLTQGSGSSASAERQPSLNSQLERGPEEGGSAVSLSNLEGHDMTGVFKGLMSETYPGLLITPNALPSVRIKVVSSRLRPSRQSLALKGTDDEPVFTLGVVARYDRQDLWQVEKPLSSLQQIDHQLRQSAGFSVKLPERSLFTGHAPAKIDARRTALETYFESVLDTQLDERAAIVLCRYLSTHFSESAGRKMGGTTNTSQSNSPSLRGPDGKLEKEGYLTKRGKNFGGWKARYFVLDKPILEYYDSPGSKNGPLGQIRLHRAQIGKQSPTTSISPSRDAEGDGQYRHAFLIREPKRKDSSSFMDHVLCAENDAERDSWVAALLCYVEGSGSENDSKIRPPLLSGGSSGKMLLPSEKSTRREATSLADSPESEDFDSLHTVPYEETKPLQAPHVSITPDARSAQTPSPTMAATQQSPRGQTTQSKAISGPQNGVKISDVGAWGNKPMAAPLSVQKQEKKRSFFGFRDTRGEQAGAYHGTTHNLNLTQEQQEYQEHATQVKAAFGAPLAEAVEYCSPRGVDVCLPAVVYRCLQYLRAKNASDEEGIFRMSGSNNLIKHLRHKFNTEGDYDFLGEHEPYCDVHAVASLLKLYLRELPSMILTRELHMQFLSVLDLTDDAQKIAAYNMLVHKMPKPNYFLIRALSAYLITVVDNSEVNKMGVRNVCIVFSPTLNIPSPVFGMFLSAFDAIFEKQGPSVDTSNVPSLAVTESSPDALTPENIRSPGKQTSSDTSTPRHDQQAFSDSQKATAAGSATYAPPKPGSNAGDTGFPPMQPTYESLIATTHQQPKSPDLVTGPGPEYAVARPRNLGPSGTNKQARRESSMLWMGSGHGHGNDSSSMTRDGSSDYAHNESNSL